MVRTSSNQSKKRPSKNRPPKKGKLARSKLFERLKSKWRRLKIRIQSFRSKHLHPHKSFRRSYREDYARETHTPGLLSHAVITFQTFFKYWRTFVPFILLMVVLYIFGVGLMSEEFYQDFQATIDESSMEIAGGKIGNFAKAAMILLSTITTGGLDTGMGEAQNIFMLLLFLIMWLVTIFLVRHFLAGEKPKLRDGLYNALGPLLSTFLIFVVMFIQAIPIMLVIITYAAALATNFLATPFYALVYFIFASLMILLSCYLLSGSLMALVAVTAPGMYPLTALYAASDLMSGRRIKFIIRLIYLVLVVALIFVVVMLPIILLDLWLKSIWDWLAGWPFVPFCLLVVTCFVFIYATIYIYYYYRWLLDYKEK